MIDSIIKFLNKIKAKQKKDINSKDTAKERLHLVLMQDRANVSADFLEMMKQEIIEVIKKYIEVDETSIDVRLTNKENVDGTTGAPALYANIPIVTIKDDTKNTNTNQNVEKKSTENKEVKNENEESKVKDEKTQVEGIKKDEVVEAKKVEAGIKKIETKKVVVEGKSEKGVENLEKVSKVAERIIKKQISTGTSDKNTKNLNKSTNKTNKKK